MRPLLKSTLVALLLAGSAAVTTSPASAHEYDSGYYGGYNQDYRDGGYHHHRDRDRGYGYGGGYRNHDHERWNNYDGDYGRYHRHHDRDRWDD